MTEAVEQQTAELDGEIAKLEEEREQVAHKVAEMRAELAVLEDEDRRNPVVWGESESKIAKRISDAAHRKLLLPRYIKAGMVKILEIERRVTELRAAGLEKKGQAALDAVQEAEAALQKAQEDLGQARFEYSDVVVRSQGLARRLKGIDTELKELKGE